MHRALDAHLGMTLSEFLTSRSMTDGQFADLVLMDRTTISRLRRGKLAPSFELLSKIAQATDGAVTPNDFLSSRDAQREDAEGRVA